MEFKIFLPIINIKHFSSPTKLEMNHYQCIIKKCNVHK